MCGQRRLAPQMVFGVSNRRVAALNCSATTIRARSKSRWRHRGPYMITPTPARQMMTPAKS